MSDNISDPQIDGYFPEPWEKRKMPTSPYKAGQRLASRIRQTTCNRCGGLNFAGHYSWFTELAAWIDKVNIHCFGADQDEELVQLEAREVELERELADVRNAITNKIQDDLDEE